jgi:predicted PurR-regulated permease PerM
MNILNSDNLKQYLLIGLIIALALTIGSQLYSFFPGLLGAITLYILMRQYYFRLTVVKNWKKWLTALLFILTAILIFIVPFMLLIQVLTPRLSEFIATGQLGAIVVTLSQKIHMLLPQIHINDEHILNLVQQLSSSAPVILGATANMLANAILAFFLLYFMLVDGRKMEYAILRYLPLKDTNVDDIWQSTRTVVVASAIGIPVLAAFQAITAIAGYAIFGVESYILWGIMTGICSLIPVVGTAVIWIPLSVYLIAIGHVPQGVGLMIYSVAITGTVDNVLRFTLLRRLGDVHPVVTTLGIIIGIPLFGFMGLIFGPLLISYLLLLIKIYRIEFSPTQSQ